MAGEASRTPPFQTKEPERYQATQIETISNADGTVSLNQQTFIARDGERRRVDMAAPGGGGGKLSRLELPDGTYLLSPERKIYTADMLPGGDLSSAASDFVPDKLLNESRPEAHYEKLGAESINGRATMKYRVTLVRNAGTERELRTESLIWVDESLGMPVRSEMTTKGNAAGGLQSDERVTMELRDISETVDSKLFELPPDYRKVDGEQFFRQLGRADSSQKGRD